MCVRVTPTLSMPTKVTEHCRRALQARAYGNGGRATSPPSPNTIRISHHACAKEVGTRPSGLHVVLADSRESCVGGYITFAYMSSHTGRNMQQRGPYHPRVFDDP
jgi:hypothetical protein